MSYWFFYNEIVSCTVHYHIVLSFLKYHVTGCSTFLSEITNTKLTTFMELFVGCHPGKLHKRTGENRTEDKKEVRPRDRSGACPCQWPGHDWQTEVLLSCELNFRFLGDVKFIQ